MGKNWSFFDHDGELYCVYSFTPCRILKIEGGAASVAFETAAALSWPGGEIRGGAAPVRVGDELWCFTHDHTAVGPWLTYRTGLVALDGKPPFAIRRIIPEPILFPETATKPNAHYASVVFPCGAVRRGDEWVVAVGAHDHWCELHRFSHRDLDARLVTVVPASVSNLLA